MITKRGLHDKNVLGKTIQYAILSRVANVVAHHDELLTQ